MKSQIKTTAVESVVEAVFRRLRWLKALVTRSRRPTVPELLVEIPLALAVISALLLASIASPGVW